MKIGELARLSEVSVDTLRFYEEKGLLQPSGRTESGYRMYAPTAIAQVRFIKSAQQLGFSLQEIADVMPSLLQGGLRLENVRALMQTKLEALDAQILRLQQLRRDVVQTLHAFTCEDSLSLSASDLIRPADFTDKNR